MKRKIFISKDLKNIDEIEIDDREVIERIKKVYRLKPKDTIYFVGKDLVEGIFLFDDPKRMRFKKLKEIIREVSPEKKINLFLSFIKKENFEFILRKASELGVFSIIPLITERSPWKVKETSERWEKIIYSVLEVTEWNFLTEIKNPIYIKEIPEGSFVLEKGGVLFNKNLFEKEVNLVVGPEGGFSEKELEILKNKNCKFISLGDITLRAETAVLVALSLLNFPINYDIIKENG